MCKKIVSDFEKSATKLIELLAKIEDQELTDEEKEIVLKNYDLVSIHGSISVDSLTN